MNDLFLYLLKVSAGIGIIYLSYLIFLRNDTNLVLKRIYLISGLLVSWLIPFISFRRPGFVQDFTPSLFIDPLKSSSEAIPAAVNAAQGVGFNINWFQVLLFIYIAGLMFLLLKNLLFLAKWNQTWKRGLQTDDHITYTNENQGFAIFKRIFIPESLRHNADTKSILLHEQAHIHQLHFIDLMIMEATLLLTWFNPFSWLISRMIKENHEHLADREVLSAGVNVAQYSAQLLNQTMGVNLFRLGHQFNHSLTLKRFKMMKKTESSRKGIIRYILLVPAIIITMGISTGMTTQEKPVSGKVVSADDGKPLPGASVVIQGSTIGTVVDRDGTFTIKAGKDDILVISFVGYASKKIEASKVTGKPIEMEFKSFNMDLEKVPISVTQSENKTIRITSKDDNGKTPVYVVDGKKVKEIDDIDPNTIEKIEVFKDSSPIIEKYNATDGVIMITTKEAAKKETGKEVKTLKNDEEVFYIVEDTPTFHGGRAALKTYIYSNLEYPASAKKKGLEGDVLVEFMVPVSGELEEIKVIQSTDKIFNEAAIEVFESMPAWKPGMQRGKPVNTKVTVPVKFTLDEE